MPSRSDHLFSFFTPGAVARSVAGLAAFAARRPALFAQLLLEGLRDRKALVQLLRLPIDADAIRNSPLFDRDWYRRNHPDLEHSPLSPELHCLLNRIPEGRWTSPHFSCDEYLSLNPAVKASGIHPLAHYELYGRFIDVPVSERDLHSPDPSFPASAREWKRLLDCNPVKHQRTAIFATYSSDGVFPAKDIFYLRALREVCDNIVVSVNAPLRPEEEQKLVGLASTIVCGYHGGYDFGSWRIGMRLASERGLLAPAACRELVFANGSCYALRSFVPMFDEMEVRDADFWSVTRYKKMEERSRPPSAFLQSYFLVFRRPVLDASALECFFAERPERISRKQAVEQFEMQLTGFLRNRGFKPDAFVHPSLFHLRGANPTTRPINLVRHFKVPLVKAKVFSGQTSQPPAKVLAMVRRMNPALAAGIRIAEPPLPRVLTAAENAAIRNEAVSRIIARACGGDKIRSLFLVSSASMFPARPLFDAMRRDPAFETRLAVIPDLRWPGRDPVRDMESCERELGATFPGLLLPPLRPTADGNWPDVIGDLGADIVCYPSPYDFSAFRYNPHWSAERGFLPVYVSYSFSASRYGYTVFGLQNYADFWKVFAECSATAKEYAEYSILMGSNADVVGYVKMDALAAAKPWPRNGRRKRVLIAPHHSVEGGANDTLALSNFQRYANYFLLLPEKHPELDFVFRPHPFLFTVLSQPSKWGRAEVDGWVARMKAHPNVRWSDEGDYFSAFASCDAIVQDCGSYLVEWFYTGKPCCYMLKDPSDIAAKFSPLGKACLSHCYLAYDEAEIEAFLRDVVEGGADPKAAARDGFSKSVMVNYPHAADAALASIKKSLGLTWQDNRISQSSIHAHTG